MKEKRSYKNTKYKNKIENECQSLLSAALAVIRVHVLPLVPVTRPQANVCRTTTNIQTAVDIIKCGARSGSPQ